MHAFNLHVSARGPTYILGRRGFGCLMQKRPSYTTLENGFILAFAVEFSIKYIVAFSSCCTKENLNNLFAPANFPLQFRMENLINLIFGIAV